MHEPTLPWRPDAKTTDGSDRRLLGFRAYVINLPKASHRLRSMENQLRHAGIPWTRIAAVNGRMLTLPIPEFHASWHRVCTGRRPIMAEIGCYLSHLEALRTFLATEDEYGLILEDDANFDERLTAILVETMQHGDCWDILRLSSVNRDRAVPAITLRIGGALGVNLTRSKGAGAYVVNRKAAHTLLDRLVPMRMAYDIAFDLEHFFGLKALAVTPLPVSQDSGFQTQIQVNIMKSKHGRARYLTVFPVRAWLESSRFVCRSWQYLKLKMLRSGSRLGAAGGDAESTPVQKQVRELRRAA